MVPALSRVVSLYPQVYIKSLARALGEIPELDIEIVQGKDACPHLPGAVVLKKTAQHRALKTAHGGQEIVEQKTAQGRGQAEPGIGSDDEHQKSRHIRRNPSTFSMV